MKKIEPYENSFISGTSYISNMNPDDLETILKQFLADTDPKASQILVIKEDKYKIKYNTPQNEDDGPIDIVI